MTDADHFGDYQPRQRRFAPIVIGLASESLIGFSSESLIAFAGISMVTLALARNVSKGLWTTFGKG